MANFFDVLKSNYKKELLKKVSEAELEEWLRRNPMPFYWTTQDKYEYAYCEMNTGRFFTWWRKYIERYQI
jgi:hypothetical protein